MDQQEIHCGTTFTLILHVGGDLPISDTSNPDVSLDHGPAILSLGKPLVEKSLFVGGLI